MSVLEAVMLVCFGVSWPLSIYRTYRVKNPVGKSIAFLWLIIIGYLAGILNKIFGRMDWVVYLYALNAAMVATDLVLVYYYRARRKAEEQAPK